MIVRRCIACSPLFSFLFGKADVPKGETPTEILAVREDNETGWDRLKRAVQPNEFGELSPEANSVLQTGCLSMFIGALYGGFMSGRLAQEEFFRNNQATAFNDHIHAKKKLQDHVTIAFGKGAYKWAWRLTFFTLSYVGISTAISVYRNENSIRDHVAAGVVTGVLYKFKLGPRGWVAGGGLGLALGLFAGSLTITLLKLTGMSMSDVRYWNYQWKEQRGKIARENFKKYLDKKEDTLYLEHNKTAEKELNLETISTPTPN